VCYSLIQHGMAEMNPRIRIRLGHAKELPLPCLNGLLLQLRHNNKAFVGYRG
jgi:hypothetical protein